MSNTFPVVEGTGSAIVENLEVPFEDKDFSIQVTATNKITGTVP